jgi:hypothetical protein
VDKKYVAYIKLSTSLNVSMQLIFLGIYNGERALPYYLFTLLVFIGHACMGTISRFINMHLKSELVLIYFQKISASQLV